MNFEQAINETNTTISNRSNSISHITMQDLSGLKLSAEWHILFLTAIIGFGVFGNIIVIHIYAKNVRFRSFNIYVISLAICDIFTSSGVASQLPLLHWYKTLESNGIYIYLFALNLAIWLSAFLTGSHLVAIAIDRVRAVYNQTTYRQSTTQVACKALAIWISSVAMICQILIMQIFAERSTSRKITVALASTYGMLNVSTLTVCYTSILYTIWSSAKVHLITKKNKARSRTATNTDVSKQDDLNQNRYFDK